MFSGLVVLLSDNEYAMWFLPGTTLQLLSHQLWDLVTHRPGTPFAKNILAPFEFGGARG
jgi:hypothetical protein